MNEEKITQQVVGILKTIKIPKYAYEQVSDVLRQSHDKKKQSYSRDLQAIETEIKKYQQRKEKVYEDYLDSKITEELYNRKFEEYGIKLRLKQEQRESLELANDDYYTTVSYLLKLAHNIENLYLKANQEQKRTILNLIVSNLELDGHLLRWKYKKPFDSMASCTEINSWLLRLGSNQ